MSETQKTIDLVIAARAGSDEAFTELCEAFGGGVLAHAMAVLRDFHLAQDVTQGTRLNAYLALSRLENPAAFGGWLKTIAHHQINRVLRRRDMEFVNLDSMENVADIAPAETEIEEARD